MIEVLLETSKHKHAVNRMKDEVVQIAAKKKKREESKARKRFSKTETNDAH